jgi:hypothetical protein
MWDGEEHWSSQSDPAIVRRQAIRRLRFGLNMIALEDDTVPPEGPIDVALTNGLAAAIVAETGNENRIKDEGGWYKPARLMLSIAEDLKLGLPVGAYIALLDATQPFRHGKADEEWRLPAPTEYATLVELDNHRGLRVIEIARRHRTVDRLLPVLFEQEAERASGRAWLSPKDQLEAPAAAYCDSCGRPTFMQDRSDEYGGDEGPGVCAACGYVVTDDESDEAATYREIRWRVEND